MVGVSTNIFVELAVVFVIAAIAAYILRLFKQPQILAYVLVGILITPIFIVGLEMDIKSLKSVALLASLGGAIQTIILFVAGYLVALILGFLSLEAAYIGLMLTFSSTMVVMKLLSDRRELSTLHGKISVGILLVQDIIAILVLSILTSINGLNVPLLGIAIFKFASLFAVAYLASKFIFPRIFYWRD